MISTLDGWVRTGMERDGRMRHTGQTYCTSWKEQGLLASERSWCLTLACGRCVRVGTSPFPHVRTLLYNISHGSSLPRVCARVLAPAPTRTALAVLGVPSQPMAQVGSARIGIRLHSPWRRSFDSWTPDIVNAGKHAQEVWSTLPTLNSTTVLRCCLFCVRVA